MTRARWLVIAVLALGACSQAASTELPRGRYSGSTAAAVGITIDVSGTHVRVDEERARLEDPADNRVFRAVRSPGRPRFECEPAAEGDELLCIVTWPDRTETIELLRL